MQPNYSSLQTAGYGLVSASGNYAVVTKKNGYFLLGWTGDGWRVLSDRLLRLVTRGVYHA